MLKILKRMVTKRVKAGLIGLLGLGILVGVGARCSKPTITEPPKIVHVISEREKVMIGQTKSTVINSAFGEGDSIGDKDLYTVVVKTDKEKIYTFELNGEYAREANLSNEKGAEFTPPTGLVQDIQEEYKHY